MAKKMKCEYCGSTNLYQAGTDLVTMDNFRTAIELSYGCFDCDEVTCVVTYGYHTAAFDLYESYPDAPEDEEDDESTIEVS